MSKLEQLRLCNDMRGRDAGWEVVLMLLMMTTVHGVHIKKRECGRRKPCDG